METKGGSKLRVRKDSIFYEMLTASPSPEYIRRRDRHPDYIEELKNKKEMNHKVMYFDNRYICTSKRFDVKLSSIDPTIESGQPKFGAGEQYVWFTDIMPRHPLYEQYLANKLEMMIWGKSKYENTTDPSKFVNGWFWVGEKGPFGTANQRLSLIEREMQKGFPLKVHNNHLDWYNIKTADDALRYGFWFLLKYKRNHGEEVEVQHINYKTYHEVMEMFDGNIEMLTYADKLR